MRGLVLLAFAVAAVAAGGLGDVPLRFRQDPAFAEFSAWARHHGRQYASADELLARFSVYRANKMKVVRLNARQNDSATYTMTQFADLTAAEFENFPCGGPLGRLTARRPNFRANISTVPLPPMRAGALPTSYDWRQHGAVTPIKNQGQCGSCWAFSTIGNIEGVNFLATKKLVSLSEQEEVDCTHTSYGCSGGWPFWAMSDLIQSYSGQVDTESSYPYTAQDGTCAQSSGTVGARISAYTSYCTEETAACTEQQMMQLLVQKGPLSVCLDASGMQFYSGGVQNPDGCDGQIDHCVTLVGYGTDASSNQDYWLIKNSWGTSWGENGYYRLIRGTSGPSNNGACSIQQVITVATI